MTSTLSFLARDAEQPLGGVLEVLDLGGLVLDTFLEAVDEARDEVLRVGSFLGLGGLVLPVGGLSVVVRVWVLVMSFAVWVSVCVGRLGVAVVSVFVA